ncbi:hypothetical protein EXN66_Car006176 [Channa argus]|uniref:Uncharacterized protein n=1 Tax=Channa argus TaxID=215402 RepID=A0A6G1PJY4_CHAAH|nr:hypothetical protein EXN66_Car006176 [Channa argus]
MIPKSFPGQKSDYPSLIKSVNNFSLTEVNTEATRTRRQAAAEGSSRPDAHMETVMSMGSRL